MSDSHKIDTQSLPYFVTSQFDKIAWGGLWVVGIFSEQPRVKLYDS